MQKILTGALAALTLAAAAPAVQAQDFGPPPDTIRVYPRFGLQVNWADETDFGVGARHEMGVTSLLPRAGTIRLITSFDYFFPEGNFNYWELNLNAVNVFAIPNVRAAGYVGGGLNFAKLSNGTSRSDLGANLLAGIRLAGTFRPYLEARLELGGGEQLVMTAGIMLR